jgi:FKBP-type peptidyl-prolyl cis-trans isomerase FkpA
MKGKLAVVFVLILTSCLKDDFISSQEQLKKDIAAIDAYLATVELAPGEFLIKDASGMRLIISEIGEAGLPPNEWDNILVDYVGKLLSNGITFDQGTIDDALSRYITGWKIGLPMLPKGSKATLYIPSVYGYGSKAVSSIPANSNLIFSVNLKGVSKTQQQIDRHNQEIAQIETHLTANEITNAIVHESGIRYIITQEGQGGAPTWYDKVKITFKMTLLNGTEITGLTTVEPSEFFSSRLVNYRQGLIIAMQLIKEGGKGTFYVPSGLAYGPYSPANLPANSVVIFEVESLEILP